MISIGCLIYRSTTFCDFVYESLHKYTPHLRDGRAEFYFVANDAENQVLDHLVERKYRHFVQRNSYFTQTELERRGLALPEYMARVYRGVNRIFSEAGGEFVVQISSDMAFSPGWLEALEKEQDGNSVVVSQLIEGARANLAGGAIVRQFGEHPAKFEEDKFLAEAAAARRPGTRPGGQYVPMLLPTLLFHQNGGYPEGNLLLGEQNWTAGDAAFVSRYARLGARHITATDSVVYHFCEGEMRE